MADLIEHMRRPVLQTQAQSLRASLSSELSSEVKSERDSDFRQNANKENVSRKV